MINSVMWAFYPVAKLFIFSIIFIIGVGRLIYELVGGK